MLATLRRRRGAEILDLNGEGVRERAFCYQAAFRRDMRDNFSCADSTVSNNFSFSSSSRDSMISVQPPSRKCASTRQMALSSDWVKSAMALPRFFWRVTARPVR